MIACWKTDRFYSDYNLSEYTDSKEFTFASEEAAKQEIYEIMDSCGIDLKKDLHVKRIIWIMKFCSNRKNI